ncbi:CvpA family protein [Alicyclobacillus shizuokensis]|uniref:CvpA family protein n=1 Tax=Alicyclobacillus shizuokensis TaxID=392014 RepID=UPI00082DF777|nr:CvpA family protein [Alicyclobacillus shizuokensis]MCL6627642.1 CvpA family protein [Alicyclobacillus shizuokensis]
MDLFDLIVTVIVVVGAIRGYQQGLFRSVMRLAGVVAAYAGAMWLRPYLAQMIGSLHGGPNPVGSGLGRWLGDVNGAIAFFLAFVVILLVVRVVIGAMDSLFRLPVLSTLNRLAGLLVGAVLALAVVYVLTLVLHYVQNPRLQQQLNHSAIATWFEDRHFAPYGQTQTTTVETT